MTIDESDQVVQRRANLDELRKLGVAPYPHRFDARASTRSCAPGSKTGETLDAEQVTNRTAGRVLAIRAFGKANFLVLSDGKSRIQVYSGKIHFRHAIFRSSDCSMLAIGSASKDDSSARRPRNSPSGHRSSSFWRSVCSRFRKSGTASPTSRRATGSAISI